MRAHTHTKNTMHLTANAAPGASGCCIYIYAMHFSISIFMGLKKRDTNNELTIRLIRSHQQVVTWQRVVHSPYMVWLARLAGIARHSAFSLAHAQTKQI